MRIHAPQASPPPSVPKRRPAEDAPLAQAAALQRKIGNRAFSNLVGNNPSPTVQRWLFIAGRQVRSRDPGLTAATRPRARDRKVRNYNDWAELNAHASGGTDYLGNLPGPASRGTWVRFSPTETNVLGEMHTAVTLEHVVRAVGSTSFTYEPFATDALPAGSHTAAAVGAATDPFATKMGVGGVANRQQFGGESVFPKLGFALEALVPYLDGTRPLSGLRRRAGYFGQPAQRYLKIAWAHAKDVAVEVLLLRLIRRPVPPEKLALAGAVSTHFSRLDPFITGLVHDRWLGDALDTRANRLLRPDLLAFTAAFIPVVLARAATDTTLTGAERTQLAGMPRVTSADRRQLFSDWRNMHFEHALADAVGRGVRYVGMGFAHLMHLQGVGLPSGTQAFDMTAADITRFERETRRLRRIAR